MKISNFVGFFFPNTVLSPVPQAAIQADQGLHIGAEILSDKASFGAHSLTWHSSFSYSEFCTFFSYVTFYLFSLFNYRIILYNIVLSPAIQQHGSALSIHMTLPPKPPPNPARLSQSTTMSCLHYTAASH